MLFNSPEFIFAFLPIVLLGFKLFAGKSTKAAIWWLALASLVFYSAWSVKFLPLLLASVAVNYASAVLISKTRNKPKLQHWALIGAISINLGALCYFKYLFPTLNFFAERGFLPASFQNVVLPLGISFFTFTQIAYLVDLKQGDAELEPFGNYLFFVTFFPHLIAGPILHHREIMPQLLAKERFRLNAADMAAGATLFVIGLFKKVNIADKISVYVPTLFEHPAQAGLVGAWIGVLCYAMQLYFDFSGYSDMAVGLALMFSVRFPLNFNSPYKARSIIDFWQCWHMTLTRYLTAYLYNPMALAIARRSVRKGKRFSPKAKVTAGVFASRIAFPTVTTMFLAGIWHGSGPQFIVFGVLHGIYLTINHAWRSFGGGIRKWALPATSRSPAVFSCLSVLVVFLAVIAGQVFFRAKSIADGIKIIGALSARHGVGFTSAGLGMSELLHLGTFLAIVWLCPNSQQIVGYSPHQPGEAASLLGNLTRRRFQWQPSPAWALMVALVLTYALLNFQSNSEFLYFQF